MIKMIGIFLLVSIGFTVLFYFFPATIFEASIVENGMNYSTDISLKGFFDFKSLPQAVYSVSITSVEPTWKGWAMLFICLIGLPMMIAYRIGILNGPDEDVETTEQ